MTSRSRALGVLSVVAALLWWLGLSVPRAAQPAPAPAPAAQPTPTRDPTPNPNPNPSPNPNPIPTPIPTVVIPPPDTRGFLSALQQGYETDELDSYASTAENALRRLLQDADAPPSMLQSVACRKKFCKLELHWVVTADAAYQRIMNRLRGDNAKFVASSAKPADASGAVAVDVYWVRR